MSDIVVEALPPQGMLTLRGDLATLGPVLADITGCAVPEMRMSTHAGGMRAFWMSPDELMVTCPHAEVDDLARRLRDAFGDAFASVFDVSDARQVFALSGPVEGAIATLAPIDFSRLAPAEIRRTRLAQIPAALWREGDGWRLVCFRSVAGYAGDLLRGARV